MKDRRTKKEFTRNNGQTRVFYILATIVLLFIEVLIALFVHDAFIRPYVGDVLVVIVIYMFVRIWFPKKIRLLPLYVFLFAVGVELLQYFEIAKLLGLQNNVFMQVLVGSVFDVKDIVCYAVGCIILVGYEASIYYLGKR